VRHLNLGKTFDYEFRPGVLPASLRELVIGQSYHQLLQPGSLPDGLEVLAFHKWSNSQDALLPGVIPSSVVVVSMGMWYRQELLTGGIPATVRWLRLPAAYSNRNLGSVLAPSTQAVWWKDE